MNSHDRLCASGNSRILEEYLQIFAFCGYVLPPHFTHEECEANCFAMSKFDSCGIAQQQPSVFEDHRIADFPFSHSGNGKNLETLVSKIFLMSESENSVGTCLKTTLNGLSSWRV
ncbi:hypothetical protein JTB14_016297 [Gonioctena quinquepunctata]|nr:hypothetical protein JTB14_016297 [Gonioctena quinquepunctata]